MRTYRVRSARKLLVVEILRSVRGTSWQGPPQSLSPSVLPSRLTRWIRAQAGHRSETIRQPLVGRRSLWRRAASIPVLNLELPPADRCRTCRPRPRPADQASGARRRLSCCWETRDVGRGVRIEALDGVGRPVGCPYAVFVVDVDRIGAGLAVRQREHRRFLWRAGS